MHKKLDGLLRQVSSIFALQITSSSVTKLRIRRRARIWRRGGVWVPRRTRLANIMPRLHRLWVHPWRKLPSLFISHPRRRAHPFPLFFIFNETQRDENLLPFILIGIHNRMYVAVQKLARVFVSFSDFKDAAKLNSHSFWKYVYLISKLVATSQRKALKRLNSLWRSSDWSVWWFEAKFRLLRIQQTSEMKLRSSSIRGIISTDDSGLNLQLGYKNGSNKMNSIRVLKSSF